MTSFTEAWNAAFEGIPADSENVNQGAQRIRALKVDVRERMLVDHQWSDGNSTNSDDGKHEKITLIVQAADPALDAGNGGFYAKTVGGVTELFYQDSVGRVRQLTSAGFWNASAGLKVGTFTYSNPAVALATIENDTGIALQVYYGSGTPGTALQVSLNTAVFSNFLNFTDLGGVQLGSVSYNGTGVAFNTTSDYRIKEDVRPLQSSLARLMGLRPVSYVSKSTKKRFEGFIAHEVQPLVPQAVVGEKDAKALQQLSMIDLIPLIVAALQDLARLREDTILQ